MLDNSRVIESLVTLVKAIKVNYNVFSRPIRIFGIGERIYTRFVCGKVDDFHEQNVRQLLCIL